MAATREPWSPKESGIAARPSVFDDAYLPLRELARYSGLSVRTLRDCLHDRAKPLPHYRFGGKIVVRRSEFDSWAKQFRRVDAVPLESMVGEMLKDIA